MKTTTALLLLLSLPAVVATADAPSAADSSKKEWIALFDGKSLTGWVPKITGFEVHGAGEIVHKVNGETVLRYEKPQIGGGNVSGHDPAVKKDGEVLTGGSISLQAESHPVEFRKVELLNLVGCRDRKAKNYKSHFEKDDPAACQYE